MVSEFNQEKALALLDEIRIHRATTGGTFTSLCGSKGSGKTNYMLVLAQQMVFIHPLSGLPMKETILWRGREIDYWNYFFEPDFEWEDESLKREVFIHVHTGDEIEFKDEFKKPLNLDGRVLKYDSAPTLYRNLVQGEINVIYEPLNYQMSPAVIDIITAKACMKREYLQKVEMDPPLFWFELVAFLMKAKGAGFLTIIMDEADEVFPMNPQGLRWHLQEWFKDKTRDLRKNNISFLFSMHAWNDIDYRISSKIMYKMWMKGAIPPPSSFVKKEKGIPRTLFLPVGYIIVERDGYGDFKVRKLKERPRVKVNYLNQSGVDWDRWVPETESGEESRAYG